MKINFGLQLLDPITTQSTRDYRPQRKVISKVLMQNKLRGYCHSYAGDEES